MKDLSALMAIALVNGLIHCQVFFLLYGALGMAQATSNLTAFGVAAGFSFYVSVIYILEPGESWRGLLLCNAITGAMSYGLGSIGDALRSPGWVTVALYCVLSLHIGYGCIRFIQLRDHRA
jgi:hypothetical protein